MDNYAIVITSHEPIHTRHIALMNRLIVIVLLINFVLFPMPHILPESKSSGTTKIAVSTKQENANNNPSRNGIRD